MRVLVVGSVRASSDPLQAALPSDEILAAAEEIGAELARQGHTVLVGSENPDDIDPRVVKGAVSVSNAKVVEVHLQNTATECYSAFSQEGKVRNIPHRYADWDVTTLEVLRKEADAVVAIAGRVGVVQAGICAWMLGKAVIPIGTFGGGGRQVWTYGSGERQDFYFGALTDQEIDQLGGMRWNNNGAGLNAAFVVQALERVAERAKLGRSSRNSFLLISLALVLTLMLWVTLLSAPMLGGLDWLLGALFAEGAAAIPREGARFALVLVSVCCAGLLGAQIQTLRRMRDGKSVTPQAMVIDCVLGVAAGFLTAALYLVAQIAIAGRLELPTADNDYVRVALTTGLAALFSSLYLDAALARFDSLRDDVLAGDHGKAKKPGTGG